MARFILNRLPQTLVVVLIAALVSFSLFRYVGDPVNNMVGQAASIADREAMRRQIGLDDPVVLQFLRFLGNSARGDLGVSFKFSLPVRQLILERLPATLEPSICAMLIAVLVGIPLGVWTALHRHSWAVHILMIGSLIGVALPTFLIGIVLILVFSVWLGWLPSFGRGAVVELGKSWSTGFLTSGGLKALILPSVTLGLFQMTLIVRLVRSEMLEVLRTDYIRFEVLGVVGESGAGKSIAGTAFLGRLDHPARLAAGRITLDGQRIDNLPSAGMRKLRGKSIGAVFQDPLTCLNPLKSVGRQIVQTRTAHLELSQTQAHARALQLLSEVGIPAARERLDSYPHELSGDMRQRVVLALAFACEPKVIIADEPTTALDVSIQAQIIEHLKRMCRERGTAVIFITHDMGVIADTADRLGVMYLGRLIEWGQAGEVLAQPKHPYTRMLFDTVPDIGDVGRTRQPLRGEVPSPLAPPPGCAFHSRCPLANARCASELPLPCNSGNVRVACHAVEEGRVPP